MLDLEQRLLQAGNLAGLEALVERKTRLATLLASEKPDLPKDRYQRLSARAAQNEALLAAAQRGLKTALAQLRRVAEGEDQSTYSAEGTRQSLARRRVSVTQKL